MAPARRATSNVDAPVWKSYVAARVVPGSVTKATAMTTRSRKRVKPTSTDTTVLSANGGGVTAKQQAATRASVRAYWESLTVAERLQILMVDDPDVVKQLYKLNLSLLCVGLMQRHLKAGTARAATAAAAGSTTTGSTSSSAGPSISSTTRPAAGAASSSSSSSASDSERTYDLLEAMEFMDIGTGILTVKTELVEDVDHMFALVTAVLHGFLTTVHVLSDAHFRDLFVAESEVINTWEDYERLIAMLVEQLMLRSYVAHLEKQATQQMEALLLEATREEEEKGAFPASGLLPSAAKKKKKKKLKKKTVKTIRSVEVVTETNDAISESESEPETQEESIAVVEEAFTCHSECSTEDADMSGPSSPVKSVAKTLNRLNPHAPAFEPTLLGTPSIEELRSPTSGKRKLDDFIIHIPWQDFAHGVDEDEETDSAVETIAGELGCRRPQDKYRRRDDDAELEWHLQHMYASTASLLGWDFNEQREIKAVMPSGPWMDASLWRTDPREVVRYYFPPTGFPSGGFPPATAPSRYYFTPPHHTPLTSTAADPPSPHAAAVGASVFPSPFMPSSSGPPVSFWDDHATLNAAYPPVVEPQPFPKFRPTNSLARRRRPSEQS